MNRHPGLLNPQHTALVVVDVQERFRSAIDGFDEMLVRVERLVRTFRILELPILVTEQYPRGLGHTVSELLEALGETEIPEKTTFSSMGCQGVPERLRESGARSVVVCGIETHVCVSQTVHDLLASDYAVHLPVDAVSSRRPLDRAAAIERLVTAGAVRSTSEMAVFELLRDAQHPSFKRVQQLFK